MRSVVAMAFALATVSPSHAESITAKTLFEWCTGESDSNEDLACSLYIAGFVHGANAIKSGILCLPAGLTAGEARAAFVRTMRPFIKAPATGNPMVNKQIDAALTYSLGMAFPCQRKAN
jgi:hypothetical protein